MPSRRTVAALARLAVPVALLTRRRGAGSAAALANSFAVGWVIVSLSAVAPTLANEYHTSLAAIGLLTTIVFVVHTVLQLPAGRLAERVGPRAVAIGGLAVMVAANLIGLAGAVLWIAVLSRVTMGVGTGLTYLSGLDYLRRAGASALLQGVFGALNGAASGLGLAILPQLMPVLHWRAPYITSGVLAALALAGALASPRVEHHRRRALPARAVIATLYRDPRLRRLALVNIGASGFASVIAAWVVTLLVRAGGYSNGTAGAIGALALFGSVASRPIGGWVMHHHPALLPRLAAAGVLLGAAGTGALAFAGPRPLAVAGSLLVGLATGLPWAYAFSGAARVRPEAPAMAVAFINTSGLVVTIGGIPLVGLAFSLPGHGRIGFLIVAALWIATLPVLLATRERPGAGRRAEPDGVPPAATERVGAAAPGVTDGLTRRDRPGG